MIDTHILIQTVAMAVFFLILEIGFVFLRKKREKGMSLEELRRVQSPSMTRFELMKQRIKNSTYLKNYEKWLDLQLNLCFEEKETSENIIRTQLLFTTCGVIISVFFLFILPYISIVAFVLTIIIAGYFPFYYKSKVDEKNKAFDEALPKFINKTIMVLPTGLTMENAFSFGLRSMDDSLTRRELEKFVAELKIHSSDISKVFVNLNKRVQTEECERFCNIIVSGLKNGNKMGDILKAEYQRISDNYITDLRKKNETKKTIATVINFLLIFVPAILLLVLPMMRIGEML